ncbi:MAG TPA: hypothetical protein VLV78_09000 [Thermoanaerobaculia bacterium]|nr:hypothetical protein [Thermoanaerobaculia bacterium]
MKEDDPGPQTATRRRWHGWLSINGAGRDLHRKPRILNKTAATTFVVVGDKQATGRSGARRQINEKARRFGGLFLLLALLF